MISADPPLEERLKALEPPYRSRGEAQAGRLLDRYGIPFFYEQPLIVLDRGQHRRWHPDFTLPGYGWLIVEYAGMPDVPGYMQGIRHKTRVFEANGIQAVFLYPWDLQNSEWEEHVMARIGEALRPNHLSPYGQAGQRYSDSTGQGYRRY